MSRRLMRRLVAVLLPTAIVLGGAGAAWAYWSSTDASHAGQASGDTLSAGQSPSVSLAASGGSTTATISFTRTATASGRTVTAFVIKRYGTASGGSPAATFTCTPAGTGPSVTCSEATVPAGTWYYADAPTVAGSLWVGAESGRSSAVTPDAIAPTVAYSQTPLANGNGYNNTSVAATLTAADTGGSGVAYITYKLDSGSSVQVNAATANFTISGEGTHSVTFTATDNAGNTSAPQSQTVKIDSTPPAAPAVTSVPASINIANKTSISISGTAEAGATVTLTLSDGAGGHSVHPSPAVATGGNWSFTVDPSSLNDGSVTLSVSATDPAGNSTSAAPSTIPKDTVAPAAPVIGTPVANSFINIASNGTAYTVSGTKEANTSLVLTVTDPGAAHTITKTVAFGSSTSWSTIIDTTGLNQGVITYSAVATDGAGNASSTTTVTNTKDTVAPSGLTVSCTAGNSGNPVNFTCSGAAGNASGDGTSIMVAISKTGKTTVNATGTRTGANWTTSGSDTIAKNVTGWTVTATQSDAAGNVVTATSTLNS